MTYIECDVKYQTGRLIALQGDFQMPIVKIHVLDGRYDERRLGNVSRAVQDALESILKIPSDDFYQVIHELPRNRFLHTPSFVGMKYSDDFILLEVAFISGRPKETRLALLKELNARIVAGAEISPDDLMIQLSEFPGENFSFGQGLAQRVHLTGSLAAAHGLTANRSDPEAVRESRRRPRDGQINGIKESNHEFSTWRYHVTLVKDATGASDDSSYITGTELFVDGGFAQV